MIGSADRAMGSKEWLLLGLLAAIWGSPYLFNRVALDDLPPLTVVLGRVAMAAVALNIARHLSGARLPHEWRAWLAFAVMGAMSQLIPIALIVWGQTRIDGGLAAILNTTVPIFTILAAQVLTKNERLSTRKFAGVVIGLSGAIIVIGPRELVGLGGDGNRLLAQFAVLVAALVYAVATIYGRRFRDLPPLVPASCQVTGSALMLLPIALIVDRPWTLPAPGTAAIGSVVGLALLCTGVASVLYFRILASAGASNLSLVTYLIPVSALILGTLVLGERVEARHFIGGAVILIGLATINGVLTHALGYIAVARVRPLHGRIQVSVDVSGQTGR
jgi:drug/metabolite transporter (DMT)-like permease